MNEEYKFIKFIGKCIAYLESDCCSYGTVPFVMNKLNQRINSIGSLCLDELKAAELICEINNRIDKMINPENLIANILDPTFGGRCLTEILDFI